jgi:hypothetical protein
MKIIRKIEELEMYRNGDCYQITEDVQLWFNLKTEYNINAWNIKAWNIEAQNINARNIEAWNISYHAFCIADGDIKCKRIDGRRLNSFHRVLDGKITIEKPPKEKLMQSLNKEQKKLLELILGENNGK